MALWCSESLVKAMEQLSLAGMAVEARQLSRVLELLGIVCERLHQHPVKGIEIKATGTRRRRVIALSASWQAWQAAGRGPPGGLVMAWNDRWDSLLMDIRVR